MTDRAPLTVGNHCLLDFHEHPAFLHTEEEERVLNRLNRHRTWAEGAATVTALRTLPMWLMASNAIIWHGTGVRLPIIGGPQTPWHWGAFLALGYDLKLLVPVLYFSQLRDLPKVAAATALTLTAVWVPTGIARHHTKAFFDLWKSWNQDLSLSLGEEADVWLAWGEEGIDNARARKDQLQVYASLTQTIPWAELVEALDTVIAIGDVDQGMVKTAVISVESDDVPKTLSAAVAIHQGKFAEATERDKLLALLKKNEKTLHSIKQQSSTFAVRIQQLLHPTPKVTNGDIPVGKDWKLVSSAFSSTERTEKLLGRLSEMIDTSHVKDCLPEVKELLDQLAIERDAKLDLSRLLQTAKKLQVEIGNSLKDKTLATQRPEKVKGHLQKLAKNRKAKKVLTNQLKEPVTTLLDTVAEVKETRALLHKQSAEVDKALEALSEALSKEEESEKPNDLSKLYAVLFNDWKVIKDQWRANANLWDAYLKAHALEWPGKSDLDYKVMFVLATYFKDEWYSNDMIEKLKDGSKSPNAFYDWAVGKAMKEGRFRDVRFGAVAAVARSMMVPS